jgi:hypothetical protein
MSEIRVLKYLNYYVFCDTIFFLFTAKDKLFNSICDEMDNAKAGFPRSHGLYNIHVLSFSLYLFYIMTASFIKFSFPTFMSTLFLKFAALVQHAASKRQTVQ